MGILTEMLKEAFQKPLNEASNPTADALKKICNKSADEIWNKLGEKKMVYVFHYKKNTKHPEIYWLCFVDPRNYWAGSVFYDAEHDEIMVNPNSDQDPICDEYPMLGDEDPDKGGITNWNKATELVGTPD